MFKSLDNLEKYLDNNMNVLLIGKHGIGKTAIVKKLFQQKFPGRWKYFSAAVMDPFLDFVGVPEKRIDENTKRPYLDLVRPKCFEDDDVEAIFMDEYNRAAKKILAATMELIQFKEINGRKFNNLKVVWAAINPDDLREYDVEKLDPAIQDRFQIQIHLPYLIDKDYFTGKFGDDIAGSAIEWWSEQEQKVKDSVSPRRLEYALDVYNIGGDLNDVLPKGTNVGKLYDNLKLGSMGSRVEKLLKENDNNVLKENFSDPNIVAYIRKHLNKPSYVNKFTEFLEQEFIMQEAPNNFEMCDYIKNNMNKFDPSLIGTLDKMDCFKESAFKAVFTKLQQHFPNSKYTSKNRTKLKEVLTLLPDVNNTKIRQSDIANLQKLINITSTYMGSHTGKAIKNDDQICNFIEKFSNIENYASNLNLGLDFTSNNVWILSNYIAEFRRNKAAQINAQNPQTQTTQQQVQAPQQTANQQMPVSYAALPAAQGVLSVDINGNVINP